MQETVGNEEVYQFQAEINQLLSIIINTFYSNKDIFLRELISNSVDALDKMRFIELSTPDIVTNKVENLQVSICIDKEANTIVIEDTGIGMSKDDLINNLGVIAKSGTKAFMESLKDSSEKVSLIGQFGVGFYSAYLVADTVQVFSKRYDSGECYKWESKAGGTFTISDCSDSDIVRGTRIVLNLKPDSSKYLDDSVIEKLIKTHNDFVEYPIMYEKEIEVEDDVVEETNDSATDTNDSAADTNDKVVENDDEVTVDDVDDKSEDKPKKMKKVKRYEKVNNQKPLWHKPPEDVTKEEYESLYKCISNDWNTYLTLKHFSVEGQIEFKSILYIPKSAPFDIFSAKSKQDNINLYVRKVFVTDNSEEIIPSYFNFVKGIVDTDDLPLNISREMLQQNNVIKQIRKTIVKRVIEMISDLSDSDFETFHTNYSSNIKLGVYEDTKNREKLMDLLRFETSKAIDDKKFSSLSDYVSRMKENQKSIYYICGESRQFVENSPFVSRVVKKGYEVIYMTDPIDEYIMQNVREYKEHRFVCITKVGLKLDDEEIDVDKYKSFCEMISKNIKGIDKVVVNSYDPSIPCTVLTDEYGHSANMERIMKAQALKTANTGMMMGCRKTFELNISNKTIIALFEQYEADNNSVKKDMVSLLYETALVNSGFVIDNPSRFAKQIFNIIHLGVKGVDEDAGDEISNDENDVEEVNADASETIMEALD